MAIYDFFLSRNGANSTLENYVGHVGRLFYDDATGVIKLSDGVTPGGLDIPYTVASDTVIGGVKAGPGVTINSEGQILIDTAGLDFTFGDLQSTTPIINSNPVAVLSSVNLNEDIALVSNGTGVIQIVGALDVHSPNGTLVSSLASEPIFQIRNDGQARMLVPDAGAVEGAFEIIGNGTGAFHSPNQTGVILHVTGNSGLPSRNYFDANNNYSLLVGRRYNGTVGNLTPVLAGEVIFRVVGQASTGTDFNTFGPARMEFRTTQNQSPTAQGGEIAFYATPLNVVASTGSEEILRINAETGVTTRDVTPQIDETYNLGSPSHRWKNVYIGQASLFIADQTTNENIEITVNNGTLLINGVASLRIGSMRITNNILNTQDTTENIQLGELGDTGTIDATNRTIQASDITATTGAFTNITGKHISNIRDLGSIADDSIVTIDFATDSIVKFSWDNNFTFAYTNFTEGSVVNVLAFKNTGTGTDTYDLDGISAGNVSTGTTTVSVVAGQTSFIEFICTNTTINGLFAKV